MIFVGVVLVTQAKNYYFSSSSGNDLRTPAQAQNANMPWKTLDKLNSFFSSLNSGDSVLLKRGDIFYGSIQVSKSGTALLPIVISSYGAGNSPVISGFMSLSNWNEKENGIYESSEILNIPSLNMVTLNNASYAMGRYPNAGVNENGWRAISSHKINSITDTSLSSRPPWTGGEVVIRKNHYVIDRNKITSHEGSTLNFTNGTQYKPTDGFGYFIQNHVATLDKLGEWYYDAIAKKLIVYFGKSSPKSYKVQASNINTLITVGKHEHIFFSNLALEGSNQRGFYLYNSNNISIKNCAITFSGGDAIDGYDTENVTIENCIITYSNNNAFDLIGSCNGTKIINNLIKYTGVFEGMAGNTSHSFTGININGDNNVVEFNEIDSTGYIGIRFAGNAITIKNNFVNFFCFIKDDGGGIYTGNNEGITKRYDQVIDGNIILNGIGANQGTNGTTLQASGIYLDGNSANVRVTGNTVAYSSKAGILLHDSHDIFIKNNTLYSNATQLILLKDLASASFIRDNTVTNNIFFSESSSQLVASFITSEKEEDIDLFGKMDSNYYSRPVDDNVTISTSYVNNSIGKVNKFYDLEGWKSRYKKDMASNKSPYALNTFKIGSLKSLNKFPNGNFDTFSSEVKCFKCKIDWQNSGMLDGSYLQVISLLNFPVSYITIPVGTIQSGKNYALSFSVKGIDDSKKIIGIYLRKSGSPYTNLTKTIYRSISKERNNYEVGFTATKDEVKALMIFALYEPDAIYFIDNIKLYEVQATITNPEKNFLFIYNPSSSDKKIFLKGTLKDIRGKTYRNSLILQPYESAVLIKQT